MVKEVSAVSYIYLKFSIVFEVLNILSVKIGNYLSNRKCLEFFIMNYVEKYIIYQF